MYCNSCTLPIKKEDLAYCSQCHVPLHNQCANHCMECGKILCDTCYAENNYLCEECYKPNNMFTKIRRSHLEQYAGCPYSLYLQLVKGIEPPMGSNAQLGVIVHEIIDSITEHEIYLTEAVNKLVEDVNKFNKTIDEKNLDYSFISQDLITKGIRCLENFWLIKDNFGKKFISEHNITYSIDDNLPKISCTLDRIEEHEDYIIIHDWKTGKALSGKQLIENLQPALYIYAVYKEYGVYPKTFNLHYLNDLKTLTYELVEDGVYEVSTSRKTYTLVIDDVLKRTKKILKDITDNKFNIPDERVVAWRCKSMCWFGLTNMCSGTLNEQWRNCNGK